MQPNTKKWPRTVGTIFLVLLVLAFITIATAATVFIGGVVFLTATTLLYSPDMWICPRTNRAPDYTVVKEWHLPLSLFPPNWYLEGDSEVKNHANFEMYPRALFLADWRYSYSGRDEHDAYTSHEVAVYGSDACAHSDYDYLSVDESKDITWGPLAQWTYTSLADEYDVAIEIPTWDHSTNTDDRVLRVRIIARYGTVVSYFHMFTYEGDVTAEQIQTLVTLMDKELYSFSRTWRNNPLSQD